jgi:cation:H+ antiporter
MSPWVAIVLGVVALWGGGELLVDGARRLSLRWGLSPLVVGLTVVSLGTSAPELAASLAAALRGSAEVAFGNVVGSNSANLGLILGAGALLTPLVIRARFLVREVPFLLGSSLLLVVVVWDGTVGRADAALLLGLLVVFLVVLLRDGSGERPTVVREFRRGIGRHRDGLLRDAGSVVGGIAVLVVGAGWLVAGAVDLAGRAGISERVIGLTLVAFGTSLPELASTLVAARRREADILIGNLVGSNVFNVLFILGVTGLLQPLVIDRSAATIDLAVMIGISLLVGLLLGRAYRLQRAEGALLVTVYLGYVVWLFSGA